MLRMMVITAHPDDEASSFGGSLRLYQERGIETCIVCLTPGQAASYRGGARNDQELSAMRREEFAAACRILKVSSGIVLDYPDGQLHRLDMQRVVSDLTLGGAKQSLSRSTDWLSDSTPGPEALPHICRLHSSWTTAG